MANSGSQQPFTADTALELSRGFCYVSTPRVLHVETESSSDLGVLEPAFSVQVAHFAVHTCLATSSGCTLCAAEAVGDENNVHRRDQCSYITLVAGATHPTVVKPSCPQVHVFTVLQGLGHGRAET
jgi:hypothetical protein